MARLAWRVWEYYHQAMGEVGRIDYERCQPIARARRNTSVSNIPHSLPRPAAREPMIRRNPIRMVGSMEPEYTW